MDESSGIRNKIMFRLTRGAGQIASGGGSELKRISKIATSQLLGSKPQEPVPETSDTSQNTGFSILNELKLMGKSAKSQLGGSTGQMSSQQITQMAKRDEEFSQKSADEIREKILSIYREYEGKRRKERLAQQQQAQASEEQKREEVRQLQKKKQAVPINPQVAKSRAEIGKNWGAE